MSQIDSSAEQLISQMQKEKSYGEVVIKFEAGRVVIMKKTETIKPSGGRSDRGDEVQR